MADLDLMIGRNRSPTHSAPDYETEPISPISNGKKDLGRPLRLRPSPIVSCPKRFTNTRFSRSARNRPNPARSHEGYPGDADRDAPAARPAGHSAPDYETEPLSPISNGKKDL
jgi:hypothetical protein